MQKQNKMAQGVYKLGNDMLSARVSLLVAARYQQEAAANNDAKLSEAGKAMLLAAHGKLEDVQTGYNEFRSEEHTSELQSLMRISYADFCLKTNRRHA